MYKNRNIAIATGTLFLIALFFNIIASGISDPVLDLPDYLIRVYPYRPAIILANILNLICALAMILIPIVLFSVLKSYNENLALSYLAFRFLEGILFIFIAIQRLTLIDLSRHYLQSGAPDTNYLHILGSSVKSEIHWATIIYIFIFVLGALSFYTVLYKSGLVPRFLSGWGILAALFLFTGNGMALLKIGVFKSVPLMKGMVYFAPPIALNELVLSVWLIAKGFNQRVVHRMAAH